MIGQFETRNWKIEIGTARLQMGISSSTLSCASRRILFRVPKASSSCTGTVAGRFLESVGCRSLTWLPRCLAISIAHTSERTDQVVAGNDRQLRVHLVTTTLPTSTSLGSEMGSPWLSISSRTSSIASRMCWLRLRILFFPGNSIPEDSGKRRQIRRNRYRAPEIL